MFRGPRPDIVDLSTTDIPRGGAVAIELAQDTRLTSVVLMGVQTTTHWVEGGIPRRLVLPVRQNGSIATATLPDDPDVAMLGHYMLFAMVDDIPSVARVVRIVAAKPGDGDRDGDVDLGDVAQFQRCFTGPGSKPADECVCMDLDEDRDVDLSDFGALHAAFTGP